MSWLDEKVLIFKQRLGKKLFKLLNDDCAERYLKIMMRPPDCENNIINLNHGIDLLKRHFKNHEPETFKKININKLIDDIVTETMEEFE